MFFGCLENCLPLRVSSLFLRDVRAYSEADKDAIAELGKYLSPVALGP